MLTNMGCWQTGMDSLEVQDDNSLGDQMVVEGCQQQPAVHEAFAVLPESA